MKKKNILFLKECCDVTFYFIFKCVTHFIQWGVYNKTDRSIKTDLKIVFAHFCI